MSRAGCRSWGRLKHELAGSGERVSNWHCTDKCDSDADCNKGMSCVVPTAEALDDLAKDTRPRKLCERHAGRLVTVELADDDSSDTRTAASNSRTMPSAFGRRRLPCTRSRRHAGGRGRSRRRACARSCSSQPGAESAPNRRIGHDAIARRTEVSRQLGGAPLPRASAWSCRSSTSEILAMAYALESGVRSTLRTRDRTRRCVSRVVLLVALLVWRSD